MSNAVKYPGEDPLKIHVTAEQRGAGWVIRVEDNGRGIAPEHQARIFMPFIRLAIGMSPVPVSVWRSARRSLKD
jgi:signal transduction histidine kinase